MRGRTAHRSDVLPGGLAVRQLEFQPQPIASVRTGRSGIKWVGLLVSGVGVFASGLLIGISSGATQPAAAPAPTVTQLPSSTATVTATTTVNMPGPTTVITETVSAAPFAQPHSVPAGTPIASATVAATAVPEAPVEQVYYPNCAAARAAGAAPVYSGEPGYGTHLDRDRDGIGCE